MRANEVQRPLVPAHDHGKQEAIVAYILFLIGAYWLTAALWYHLGGDPKWIWICMLPAAWLGTLGLLRDYGSWRGRSDA